MTKENFLRQILYIAAWLIILVTILFPIATIFYLILDKTGSATPGSGMIGTAVVVVLHLLFWYSFREAIIVNKRHGRFSSVVYIISGVGLLIFGLLILQIAREFLGNNDFFLITITYFLCSSCDFFAATIAFTALFLQPSKKDIN
jgi:hypothetical protein